MSRLLNSRQVTDSYLLALAARMAGNWRRLTVVWWRARCVVEVMGCI